MLNFTFLVVALALILIGTVFTVIFVFVQDKYLTYKILWESLTGWFPNKRLAKSELMYQIINDSLYKEVIKIDQHKTSAIERDFEISNESAKELKALSANLNRTSKTNKQELLSRDVINEYLLGVDNISDNLISAVSVFSNKLMVDFYKLLEQRSKIPDTEFTKQVAIDAKILKMLYDIFPKSPVMRNILIDQIEKMKDTEYVNKDTDFSAIQLTHSIDPKKLLINLIDMKYNKKGQSLGFNS
ncbi:hypothetical protein [Leuconostoc mesenteroides]|uniref:hypothetical protein n=1 Tax=Leuconostoc mesenteroides TaxID=1245 RepID=UPI000E096E4A|nr:hypothetical protein [Leuconostoc mesenteroides]RDF91660.1 hypothetical protein DQM09_06565 [Leuconostoc mesenteroides subsp. mesenteroides]